MAERTKQLLGVRVSPAIKELLTGLAEEKGMSLQNLFDDMLAQQIAAHLEKGGKEYGVILPAGTQEQTRLYRTICQNRKQHPKLWRNLEDHMRLLIRAMKPEAKHESET